jgi:hypothetical protein
MCHASKERVLLFGTDQRITSGPAARTAAFKGRIHGCTRTIRGNVRFFSCIAGAVHTWHFVLGALVVLVAAWELWQDWKLSAKELAGHGQ